jgi:hypothetical protein
MTEVLDAPLVSSPSKAVVFAARREDLRLVRVPRYPVRDAGGQQVSETQGTAFQFRHGLLTVPAEGTVQTEDGREVDAADVMAWLMSHKRYNDREEGFFKVETAAPPPSPADMALLLKFAREADVAGFERVIAEEQAGWNRKEFLDIATGGLKEAKRELAELKALEKK